MLSTLEDGKIVRGLEGIPNEGPAILVGYHMFLSLEMGPLVTSFLNEREILLRVIAHPFFFARTSELLMPDSSSFDVYRILGAVPVSAGNLYRLLSQKCFVLLYPGGAREAMHRKLGNQNLYPPGLLPKIPGRDKAKAQELYMDVKCEVERPLQEHIPKDSFSAH
ncbi:Acyltransferase-like protein, chloroplastic [Ananas comosus]|uniref:Acyltransferase-like protein, chloroplastic n=1 Tax=Ananas comosus TaxID=4615 RepID=A0A199VMS7_ANACO|nr:Acyltransferase-like protein, chloroplastic [Ananas comosus]